tara:strand:+ start:683 stop:898 length:216 start_codon:yes stop_codon:yes gene_type:complete
MKNLSTHTITFSIRDWEKGSWLLQRLGFQERNFFTDDHEITINDNDSFQMLESELNELDIEYSIEPITNNR